MKKRLVIALVVSIILLFLIILNILIFAGSLYGGPGEIEICTLAGGSPDEYSFGKYIGPIPSCCGGLDRIDVKHYEDGECYILDDVGTICSDCGNGKCEEWENPCNCAEDCD